jgi:hypothetical protein
MSYIILNQHINILKLVDLKEKVHKAEALRGVSVGFLISTHKYSGTHHH